MGRFMRYWMPVLAYCAIIFVQSSFPSPELIPSFRFSDKLLHVVAYGLLGALICRAAGSVERWHRRRTALFWIGVIGATLYGLSDEWHQSFVPGRYAESADLLADFAGSLIGCWAYLRFAVPLGHTDPDRR